MDLRTNFVLSHIIEQGIEIDERRGAANAWAFLSSYDVPHQTILRVLSSASSRRANDEPTNMAVKLSN